MPMRTSATHPLAIAELAVPGTSGRLGLTFCPGKRQPHAATGAWDRDLATDLEAIAAWGATAVVTLMEAHELEHLGVPGLGDAVAACGMAWHHLPIRDVDVPDAGFEAAWTGAGAELARRLAAGERVLLHCKGGLGRTGTIAARLLVGHGTRAEEAISRVRAARPGAIETRAQEAYVRALAARPPAAPAPLDRPRRIRGCLLAGACGDAPGAPVEFMRLNEIRRRYGPAGITAMDRAYGRVGAITDDTQMTLFTAEGLILARRGGRASHEADVAAVHAAYLRWLTTQGPQSRSDGPADGWLLEEKALWSRRAPGNTCLPALRASSGIGGFAGNDSKGCGGVMRVAPAAFVHPRTHSASAPASPG